jgi:hypothetical protein
MTDALLAADQHFDWGFLPVRSPGFSAREPLRIRIDRTSQAYDPRERGKSPPLRAGFGVPTRGSTTTVEAHLRGAQHALAELEQPLQRAQRDREYRQELRWLAENRHRFSGRWIALEGDRLLAAGDTSREVFLQVANRPRPPLVIRIDEEDLPFAGW